MTWRRGKGEGYARGLRQDVCDEVADVFVVLCNLAVALERIYGIRFDLVEHAIAKARRDERRGRRENVNGTD